MNTTNRDVAVAGTGLKAPAAVALALAANLVFGDVKPVVKTEGLAAPAFVLAERGKEANCAIVVPDNAPAAVRYAAEELRDFTEKTTGVRLEIFGMGGRFVETPLPKKAVVLEVESGKSPPKKNGPTVQRFNGSTVQQPDAFRIHVEGNRLRISGGSPRGVLYGVYELLERFAGCRWYASWHTVAPARDRIEVPSGLDETHVPAFAMREPYWFDVRENQAFAARLRVNSRSWRTFDEKFGGNPWRFGGGLGSCHTFDTLLPPDQYFDAHPEYFSLVGGRRIKDRTQLCLTNPDVLRIVTSNVLERIRKDPGAKFYGVSQNDWFNFCECPDCKAVDDEEGSHAGTMIRFVNAIAEAVEKEFPDALIETLAYQYTRKAPAKTRPRRNVVPCLCTIECDFARPIDESPFAENAAFLKDIADWSRISDFLYIWDYTTDFGHYLLPWDNVHSLQGNLRLFRDNNAKAVFEQGDSQGRHADFAELKAWLLAKWMWNPDLPMEPLLDDFFAGYYGKGAPFVREYFERLHRLQADYSAGSEHPLLVFDGVDNPALSDSFLEEAAELWAKAADAVKDDPATSYNVRMGAMSVDYARLERANRLLRFTEPAIAPETARAIAQSLLTRMEEAKPVRLAEADRSETISRWRKIAAGEIALGKSETGELEDRFLPIANRGKWGEHVDDPKAGDGRALQLFNTHFQWCTMLPMSRIAFEPGRKYRLSARVRVEKAGDGEAFWAGVYSKGAAAGRGGIETRTADIHDGEYHWYDVLEWVPAPDECFWIAPGRFDKDGRSAIAGVWIDKIVFTPVLWPSGAMELRAQPDSALAMQPDGSAEVTTGTSFAFPGVRLDFPEERDLSAFGRVVVAVSNTTDRAEKIEISIKGTVQGVEGQVPGGSVRLSPHEAGELRVNLKNMPWALDAPLPLDGMRGYPKAPGDGSTFDLRRVRSLHIFIKQDGHPGGFAIRSIAATAEGAEQKVLPAATFLPFVDRYGQFAHDDWPGKVHGDEDLAAACDAEAAWLAENAAGPIPDANQYGGWAGGPQLEATGFFRTEKVDGKWWFVDPEGRLFFSHGVDAVATSAETGVSFREKYFTWLPPKDDPDYGAYWSVRAAPEAHGFYRDPAHVPFDRFDFAKANARRKYGPDWARQCAERTHARMRAWGLNTLAAWSDVAIREMRRTPYTAKFNTRGPAIEGSTGWWGKLRDPFAPEFEENVRKSAAEAAARSGDDPWCIGWFVDNELSWGKDDREIGRAVLRSPATQPAKRAARDILAAKYGDAAALDDAWGTAYGSWEGFLAATDAVPDESLCGDDLAAIHRAVVAKYFRTVRDAVKTAAPNRLYLGCRIAWGRDVIYEECARYADVVSVNAYGYPPMRDLPPTAIDKPLLSGEFHFGALDRGMFHTGLVATRDQKARADAYRAYVGACLDHPRYVGTHWFQWMDQPLAGRGDGENYEVGFVTVTDAPYPELVRAARDTAATMYQRRYEGRKQ